MTQTKVKWHSHDTYRRESTEAGTLSFRWYTEHPDGRYEIWQGHIADGIRTRGARGNPPGSIRTRFVYQLRHPNGQKEEFRTLKGARMGIPEPCPLTREQQAVIGSYANRVWQEIGYDVLTMVKEQDGKDAIPRDEVIELVCDAGRLEDELRRALRGGSTAVTQDMINWVTKASMAQMEAVLLPAFPFTRYGL
jgi:hypothetical protein